MRAGVWCGIAVTLLFVATDAIRTVQVIEAKASEREKGEGISRISRRTTTTDRGTITLNKTEDNISTIRPRGISRREETQESSTLRSRNRGRTVEKENISPKVEIPVQSEQNGPFESRRSSIRSRSRTIAKEATTQNILNRESIIRGRSRGSGRKFTSSTIINQDQPGSSSNKVAVTLSSRSVEINPDINPLTKSNEIYPTGETAPSNQFRRRSSTVSTVEDSKLIRPRGRVNTRTNSRALDLEVAGTTNTFTAAAKQTTIAKITDGRVPRKLRYKSRTLETDTNLAGDGITNLNEVGKSSQSNDVTSQPEFSEIKSTTFKATEKTFPSSTESVLTSSTLKSMKVVRRPITRSNGYLKPSEVKSNSKISDEISEDDNYPESFKALIQAKNATQANSSIGESLTVKASHIVSKTHAQSIQTNTSDPGTDKNSRLRKKLKIEENSKNNDEKEVLSVGLTSTTTTSEAPKPKSIPFRPRGTYLPRGKKPNATKSTTDYATRPNVDSSYKFSKRIKSSTEPSKTDIILKSKRVDSLPKKQVIRSSLFSRKNDPVNKNITVIPLNENRKHDRVQSGSYIKARRTLPSTTYYSRLRNNTKLNLTEASYIEKNTETPIAEKKVENSADMPLIFTYLNGAGTSDKVQSTNKNNATVVLNSKDLQENSTENEIVNKAEESENKLIINTDATTQKYHANYKENIQSEKVLTSATPTIRNIKTRKYARKQEKPKEQGTNTPPVIFKSRDRNVRKYGDTFSKATESPANTISQEPEKPKHKFSSKYRGSYLDRPFYKPTVPTVTPSTAWEKFFVTDEYTQFVEEPILFGNDFSNNTTEIMSRINFTSPTYTHESSIELVEGEEIQLGPDMNAIAITKTHRPLTSADLRLSESLAKPLQVLNVEASNHSPSVTVSIFDALAEILTSTPKPRISTTAETLPKNINEINIMHSLDGVSSNVNVNTITGFASQETVTPKDNLNTNAKFVQTTEQVVFNSLLVGDNVTPSLKAEDEKTSFVTSPKTVPIPIPTTPISARKPFAIKVLYSETESTNKNSPTTMPTTTVTSTDKSTMVYNSISDLLLSNNGVLSSGLTSMLSNNIRSIIDSMDDESKSRLSVGMTNLLNTLTPSAINNIPKVEDDSTSYMTTPYSLEDINDTANVDIIFNDSSNINNNILQNVSRAEKNVNSTDLLLNSPTEVDVEGITPVNSPQPLENVLTLKSDSDSDMSLENNVSITTLNPPTKVDVEGTTPVNSPQSLENLLISKSGSDSDISLENNVSITTPNPPTEVDVEGTTPVNSPQPFENLLTLKSGSDSDINFENSVSTTTPNPPTEVDVEGTTPVNSPQPFENLLTLKSGSDSDINFENNVSITTPNPPTEVDVEDTTRVNSPQLLENPLTLKTGSDSDISLENNVAITTLNPPTEVDVEGTTPVNSPQPLENLVISKSGLDSDISLENNVAITTLNPPTEVDVESTTPVNSPQPLENLLISKSGSDSDISLENNISLTSLKDTESTTASLIVNNNMESLDEAFTNKEPDTPPIDPLRDITTETSNNQLQSPSLAKLLSSSPLDKSEVSEESSQVSQLQLWVLSKKARVLKMIEDLLRQHSEEISNPPAGIQNLNTPKLSFSNRLTEIMNTMNLTTIEPDFTERTTPNFIESNSTPTAPFTPTLSRKNDRNGIDFVLTTQNTDDIILGNDESSTKSISEIADAFTTANSELTTTMSEDIVGKSISTTPTSNFETTIGIAEPRNGFDTSTKINVEDTTTSGIETTTATVINESKSADFITNSNMLNVATRPSIPKKDFVIFGILPNNTVVRKDPNDNPLEALTEASPYIIYGVLPNNTIIRKFPNGTRVPHIMQKIDVLPISPWSLKNPYSPIHNIPAIVRPQSNPIRVSTNTVISTDIPNNEKEISLTTDTVNNLQVMIPTSALNINDSSSLGITTTTQPPAEKSTASHVLSLRTTTMLPSIDEILLNSISLATKEEMVISSMTSSTPEPRILTLDIDPETKQIRTEKPNDGNGNTVFKFIPIEDVTVPSTQETNVLKLASPKTTRATTAINIQTSTLSGTTEFNTQKPQIQMNTESNTFTTSTIEPSIPTPSVTNSEKVNDELPTPIFMNEFEVTTESQKLRLTDLNNDGTTFTPEHTTFPTTTSIPELQINTDGVTNTNSNDFTTTAPTTYRVPTATSVPIGSATNTVFQTQTNPLPLANDRNPKKIGFNTAQNQQEENAKLLQALLMATSQNKNSNNELITKTKTLTTTSRSIEDDIRQFEEDTKLLKALLQATGRDPASLNLPALDDIKAVITTSKPSVTTTTFQTTTKQPTTAQTTTVMTTTPSINNEDIKRLQEDTKLLQALLQVTGNKNSGDMPIISGLTSNVRIASNPLTTSMESKSTTSFNVRPVYTTTQIPPTTTVRSPVITVSNLQPTTEDIGISTTFRPINVRIQSTTANRPTVTTEIPSSSTYSDEEDLLFLKNLKSVLSTKSKNEDPETSLANRVIALAVERSLSEIQVGKSVGTTKVMTTTTPRPTTPKPTTPRPTTTTTKTTTTQATTTHRQNIPSIEDDIKQFEQDTKLLQALLKATGQDPSKFNIPTLPTTTVSAQLPQAINDDLKLLSNLLASPSPLNEPFDPLTQKPADTPATQRAPSTTAPYGIQIAVKDDLKNEQDDAKLLQTLIKLQDAQETTTMRSKLAITGHSSDEALKKLIQKTQPAGMMSESTKPSMSLSTEYGNSNDALLAALLKEQGFGPTTASSLDEQIRLAALLNQVVVTPKARRTTTPPPPPPAPRRPILDGLAWLWQQWRDTAPGSQGPPQSRPAPTRSQPAPTRNQPAQSASTTSSRMNWFGSGPFVGNADERPANRIPLEPPSAVEQPPGRGQLVSAAINVTRAFSQFLGAAIQGAAQTVQNVFRAGQKVASDTYTNGSGGSG